MQPTKFSTPQPLIKDTRQTGNTGNLKNPKEDRNTECQRIINESFEKGILTPSDISELVLELEKFSEEVQKLFITVASGCPLRLKWGKSMTT